MGKLSLREKIFTVRMNFARNNYGKYPNRLILSPDMMEQLMKECELMARRELFNVGEYNGMQLSISANYGKKNIIECALIELAG